jgi:predicted RNA binding protein YcfA (HicA-like mRNA interferase family)
MRIVRILVALYAHHAYYRFMRSRDIIKKLKQAGFEEVHSRGSHMKLKHPDGRMVIVPHPKMETPIGTLRSIERLSKVKLR